MSNLDTVDYTLFENINKRKWWEMEQSSISSQYSLLDEYVDEYKNSLQEYNEYEKLVKKPKKKQKVEVNLEYYQMKLEDSRSAYLRKHEEVKDKVWNIHNISALCLIIDNYKQKDGWWEDLKNRRKEESKLLLQWLKEMEAEKGKAI